MNESGVEFYIQEYAVGVDGEHMLGTAAIEGGGGGLGDGGGVVLLVEDGPLAGAAAPGEEVPGAAEADAGVAGRWARDEFMDMHM